MPAPRGDKWETDVEARLARLEQRANRPFSGTGLSSPDTGVTQVDGDLNVVGRQTVTGPISVHGTANFDGDTTIGGNAAITGTLSLPNGIINNDALASPVIPGSVWQQASNFTLGVAWNAVINYNLPVPAGVTSASISAKARVTGYYNNPGTGSGVDYLYSILYVGSVDSDYYPLAVTDNGGSGTNQVFRDVVLAVTPGGVVNFQFQVATGFNTWTSPSSPGNKAQLGADVKWFR